jgi:hypothetical protein
MYVRSTSRGAITVPAVVLVFQSTTTARTTFIPSNQIFNNFGFAEVIGDNANVSTANNYSNFAAAAMYVTGNENTRISAFSTGRLALRLRSLFARRALAALTTILLSRWRLTIHKPRTWIPLVTPIRWSFMNNEDGGNSALVDSNGNNTIMPNILSSAHPMTIPYANVTSLGVGVNLPGLQDDCCFRITTLSPWTIRRAVRISRSSRTTRMIWYSAVHRARESRLTSLSAWGGLPPSTAGNIVASRHILDSGSPFTRSNKIRRKCVKILEIVRR